MLLFPLLLLPNALAQPALEKCKHASLNECISSPHLYPEVYGTLKVGLGQCSIIGTAYVPGIRSDLPLPGNYNPMSVTKAHQTGLNNKVSEWNMENQEKMKEYCPLLQKEMDVNGNDLLCCTERQFEGMQGHLMILQNPCPSCSINLRNIFCQSACSPNNSLFTTVNQIRVFEGEKEHVGTTFNAVEDMDMFVSDDLTRDLYDFCLDDPLFMMVCQQGCSSGLDSLNFMGAYGLGAIASPQGINFKTMTKSFTKGERKEKICSCRDFEDSPINCIRPLDTPLNTCYGVCGQCAVDDAPRSYMQSCIGDPLSAFRSPDGSTVIVQNNDEVYAALWSQLDDNVLKHDFSTTNIILLLLVVGLVLIIVAHALWMTYRRKQLIENEALFEDVNSPGSVSRIDAWLSFNIANWGRWIAIGHRPHKMIAFVTFIILAVSLGLLQLETETDPVALWVAKSSQAYQNRDRYGKLFSPFYRTEQIILVPTDGGEIGRTKFLRDAIRLQEHIATFTTSPFNATYPNGVTLNDICWKATGTACTVNSITQYYQNNLAHFEAYAAGKLDIEHMKNCLNQPTMQSDNAVCSLLKQQNIVIPEAMTGCPCFSAYGAPMDKYTTFVGGIPDSAQDNVKDYVKSKAMLSTALVYNNYDEELNALAVHWEKEFVEFMKSESATNAFFDISFFTEMSVEDQIKKESRGSILPVAMSYLWMLIYVTLVLGKWKKGAQFWIKAKFTIGFLGVLGILGSVASTIGLFSAFGVKVQLVIVEVVPFLTLAIGVDNIFLLKHALDKAEIHIASKIKLVDVGVEVYVMEILAHALGSVGPSIIMSSLAESMAFAFGCISPMPVVMWFAAFASVAILINLVIQLSLFVAFLTLDKRREVQQLPDVLCCFQRRLKSEREDLPMKQHSSSSAAEHVVIGSSKTIQTTPSHDSNPWITSYSNFLCHRVTQTVVLCVWVIWLGLSIWSAQNLDQGLAQKEAVPTTSYLSDYFTTLENYLSTGPPIYFVVESGYGNNPDAFEYENNKVTSKFCESKIFCDPLSIPKILKTLQTQSERTRISDAAIYSWFDTYWDFTDMCCQVNATTNVFIQPRDQKGTRGSKKCLAPGTKVPPIPKESFMPIANMFMRATAGVSCVHGGASIFQGQLSIDENPLPISVNPESLTLSNPKAGEQISAFSYMTISTSTRTQMDFIDTYKQANLIAEWMSKKTGVSVWAYSSYFVFFDQYLTIVHDSTLLVGITLLAIFIFHAIYFTSIVVPLLVTATITSIVICVLGVMGPLEIMLNGLSVVNLIIAAGISVEFVSHLARAYMLSPGQGNVRLNHALQRVMMSVLLGITITKCIGLSALSLADSRIFLKYYFRMYMSMVLIGFTHGLIFFPVLLNIVSPKRRGTVTANSTTTNQEMNNYTAAVTPKN